MERFQFAAAPAASGDGLILDFKALGADADFDWVVVKETDNLEEI